MTSLIAGRLKRLGVVWVAALAFAGSLPTAVAANADNDRGSEEGDRGTAATGVAADSNGQAPAAPGTAAPSQPVPQLQIQDEGPSAADDDVARVSRRRIPVADDTEERPFWKHWAFWAVTGALIAGAVGMVIYTTSGSNSALAPCPPDVVVSLGCFGSGRGP